MKIILIDAWECLFLQSGIDEEMLKYLNSLENKKIVLTNANDEQFKEFGIDKSPYDVFTLKHNPDKSEGGYYEKLIENMSLNKNELIYIEHDIEAVNKSREFGINTMHYVGDIEELKNFISKNI